MAQAVYCTFCTAFPTSYKQFGDEFKENLVQLIHEWIAGWFFFNLFNEQCIYTYLCCMHNADNVLQLKFFFSSGQSKVERYIVLT